MSEEEGGKKTKKKRYVVPVSSWLRENVLSLGTGFESDFKELAADKEKSQRAFKEIKKYVNDWLDAAEKLPLTARRSRDNPISEEWIAAARKEFEPVDNSWLQLCFLLKLLVRVLRYFKEGDGITTTRGLLKKPAFFCDVSILDTDGYRLYISLRSWLYRHSEAGKRKAREYEKKPEVKKLRQKPREYERERKKAWRAQKKDREAEGPGLMVEEWEAPKPGGGP